MDNPWPYPGSRWWKFDFHTHTPASLDTIAWQTAKGTEVTPEKWLQQFMEAKIDCVVVSDHNSGDWIDDLKATYDQMKGDRPEGFRELVLFPGVELSVNSGFHMLAVFDSDKTSADINSLLGAVDYQGTKGDSDGVTKKSPAEVIDAVIKAGGLPIPAHVDQSKGLLRLANDSDTRASLDANTLKQVLESSQLLAMEQVDRSIPLPTLYKELKVNWTSVLGSDCHSFEGKTIPGSRYTWVKMAKPCLEGLRLALIDGNEISIRRSDENNIFNPFSIPDFFIESIEVHEARYMGRGPSAQRLDFSPYMNALIGGRGTGKSTIVHALRLAFDREVELDSLDSSNSPRAEYESFRISEGNEGALKSDTKITVTALREHVRYKIRFNPNGIIEVEEEGSRGEFKPSTSQTVNPERFPLRLLSQGQIAAMTGKSSRALLNIIDQAAGTGAIAQRLEEAKTTWRTLRARLRELDASLTNKSETERKLTDIQRKLAALDTSQHAETLKAYQRAGRQKHEAKTTLSQLEPVSDNIDDLLNTFCLDDWPEGTFDSEVDGDILQWKQKAQGILDSLKKEIAEATQTFSEKLEALQNDSLKAKWQSRISNTETSYETLKLELAEKGIENPQAYDQLFRERQLLESELRKYGDLENDKRALEQQIDDQFKQIENIRVEITETRSEFVTSRLKENEYVKIEVKAFGSNLEQAERDFRELIGVTDQRFENDILAKDTAGKPTGGLLFDLYKDGISKNKIEAFKKTLESDQLEVGGKFSNYLTKLKSDFDFTDRLRCWFPEDDLRISYKRGSEFVPIQQGSKGQKAAAILAFLLSFGEEPLVLDQPEDDLDNSLIYELIVKQMRKNKLHRQLIVATHNPNIVVNGDAEMVFAFDFKNQCYVSDKGSLQDTKVGEKVCEIMEGGKEAFERRWKRVGKKG